MTTAIERFGRNEVGRDFVVGDIHGCFDQLRAALEPYAFAADRDRLFTVGDLVDRGGFSAQALEWLANPWFHSCRGNHEEMLLTASLDYEGLAWFYFNGGEWWLALDDEARRPFLEAFARLPVAMEVETKEGRVGIVHADVPEGMDWETFLRLLEAGDGETRHTALWGRRRAHGLVQGPVEGIDRVVCGHSIMPGGQLEVAANVWFVDTGAFLHQDGSGLTVLPLNALFEKPAGKGAPVASEPRT